MKAVKVKPSQAENVRKRLADLGMFNSNYHVKKDNEYVYFPVVDTFKSEEYEVVEIKMEERNLRKKLRDYLDLFLRF